MNGITIGLDPTILSWGHFGLRWYGLFFVLAVLAGSSLGLREARRRGFDAERVQSLILWAALGGLAGVRLFHVIDRWDFYAAEPLRALYFWEGGLAVYGGLLGGVLVGFVYAWRLGLPAWRLADALAPGMILGQALGRLACIPNGDAYGAPTDAPWAFVYTNPAAMVPPDLLGKPLHPYPVLERQEAPRREPPRSVTSRTRRGRSARETRGPRPRGSRRSRRAGTQEDRGLLR